MNRKKRIDPIPEKFSSYEEAAAFWDKHDTTDYPDAFRKVEVTAEFKGRRYEVEIEADVVRVLRTQARKKGITMSRLASDLLRRQVGVQ